MSDKGHARGPARMAGHFVVRCGAKRSQFQTAHELQLSSDGRKPDR